MNGILGFLRRFAPWVVITLGAVLAIFGVLTRTAWAPDPFWTASVQPDEDTRLVISDPGMLNLMADNVTIEATVVPADDLAADPEAEDEEDEEPAEGEEEETEPADGDEAEGSEEDGADASQEADEDPGVIISIARDIDAEGWVGDAAALRLTGLQTESTLRTSEVDGELEAAASEDSDLWWQSASGLTDAQLVWQKEPGRWSAVIASSADRKISQVSFTWPQSTETPLAMPLIMGGALLILAGAALLVFPQALDRDARGRFATSVREKAGAAHPQPAGEEVGEEQVATGSTTHPGSEADADLTAPVEDAGDAQAAQPAQPEDVSQTSQVPATAADEDLVVAESVVAAEDAPAISDQQVPALQQAPAQPQPVAPAASAPEPIRFAPGTMTRRQIRELERQRQEEARRAKEPPRASQPRSGNESPGAAEPSRAGSPGTAESSHVGSPGAAEPSRASSSDAPEQRGSQPPVGSAGGEAAGSSNDTSRVRRSEHWRKTWGVGPESQTDARTTGWLPQAVDDEEDRDA